MCFFFFSSRRRHTRYWRDWSSDVCSSDLVGKTTTAINLGTALAAVGEHVLIVDLDPQGNASTGLGIDRKSRRYSTYDVLTSEASLRDAILPTAVPRLSIAPSTLDLSGLELQIAHERD